LYLISNAWYYYFLNSQQFKLRIKINDEYSDVQQLPASLLAQQSRGKKRPLETGDGASETNGTGPVPMQLDNNEHLPQITGGHAYPSASGLLLIVKLVLFM
jgi:hypothetical protein